MNVNERSGPVASEFGISWSFSGGGGSAIYAGTPVFVAAEPRISGGSPRIYSGEERLSAPIKRSQPPCALALGTS